MSVCPCMCLCVCVDMKEHLYENDRKAVASFCYSVKFTGTASDRAGCVIRVIVEWERVYVGATSCMYGGISIIVATDLLLPGLVVSMPRKLTQLWA